MTSPRPIRQDPSAEHVQSMFVADQTWVLDGRGAIETSACEAMRNDGTGYQRCIAIRIPGRINKTDEEVTIRLLLSPANAKMVADCIEQSVAWLAALDALER